MNEKALFEAIKFDEQGLIPVIVQDYHAKKVRMLAYMNKEALVQTLKMGKVHYYSRSRNVLWLKGETSGQYQYLKGVSIDCDGDTLLIQIEQATGISCHTGHATCFFRTLEQEENQGKRHSEQERGEEDFQEGYSKAFYELSKVIESRRQDPVPGSYTNYLLEKGENKILKKVGEECTEVIIAAKEHQKDELVFELADLMYHLTLLMNTQNVTWQQVENELAKRK